MLEFIRAREMPAFRSALKGAMIGQATGQTLTRNLTTPGGSIKDASIIWRPDLGLWAYFSDRPYEGKRWLCWFGLQSETPPTTLRPAVEINVEVDPENRNVRGRAMVDRNTGAYYLGHRGGLGGGRGGEMSIADFARGIRDFAFDTIERTPGDGEDVFVVQNLSANRSPHLLRRYVEECVRLRSVARRVTASEAARPDSAPGGFRPEPDQDGFQTRSSAEIRAIRRRHGRVVNALEKALPRGARNTSRSRIRPDLYLSRPDGSMSVLFEVKAVSDTQSWFTALGQLVVYGAEQQSPPQRVLVCPAKLNDPAFALALELLEVDIVTFKEIGSRIIFSGLEEVLGRP